MSRVETQTFCPGAYWGEGTLLRSAKRRVTSTERLRAETVWFQTFLQHWNCCWTEATAMFFSSEGNSGSWYPWEASNKDRPVAKEMWQLQAHSTQGSWVLHEDGWDELRQRRDSSSSWFIRSVWPLVCGWNPELRTTIAPKEVQTLSIPESWTEELCLIRFRGECHGDEKHVWLIAELSRRMKGIFEEGWGERPWKIYQLWWV